MTNLNNAPILPKHLLEGKDIATAEFNGKPVGTGPFRLGEIVKGSHYVLERNPDYFKPGRPYLDRVVLRVMPNPPSRVLAFEKGEVDVLYSFFLPREQAARVKALPGVVVKDYMLFPEVITLFFNLKDSKPLGDLKVRQAIAHGIDKAFIAEKGYFGLSRPAISPIPSNLAWAHNPKVMTYAYDTARAQALLDEAGYKGPERMTLRLAYDPANSAVNKAAEIVAQQLRVIGINVKQTPMERSLMLEKVFKQYEFDIFIHNYTTYGEPAVGRHPRLRLRQHRARPVHQRGALLQQEGGRAVRHRGHHHQPRGAGEGLPGRAGDHRARAAHDPAAGVRRLQRGAPAGARHLPQPLLSRALGRGVGDRWQVATRPRRRPSPAVSRPSTGWRCPPMCVR